MYRNEVRIELILMDFEYSPEHITSLLGVLPTKTWKRGDLVHEKGTRKHKENGWVLSSGLSKEEDFELHITSLISIINSHIDQFMEVCSMCYVELSCVLYMYCKSEDSTPAVHFDKQAIKVLNTLGAEIDIDLYVL